MTRPRGLSILLLLAVLAPAGARAEEPLPALQPMGWTQGGLWALFWAPRWSEDLLLPPRLLLSEAGGNVQSRTVWDPALRAIVTSVSQRELNVLPPRVHTPEDYADRSFHAAFTRAWKEETSKNLKGGALTKSGGREKGGLVNLDLPFQLPGIAASIFGEGAPNLRVSGSERISVGGTSSWRVNDIRTEGQRRSKFPTLEMRQELNVQLRGTVGDKLHIDINQNSEASSSLENQIRIYYQGYEDDVIQRIDLGNTNLALPRTQNISVSLRQEGLFGVKMTGRLADWDFTLIASKQQGQAENASFTGGRGESRIGGSDGRINDYEYEKRKYFFLIDPDAERGVQVSGENLAVYLNTNNNPALKRSGAAYDTAEVTVTGQDAGPKVGNLFVKLTPNEDYYFVNSDWMSFPYLVMRSALGEEYTLAVSYKAKHSDGSEEFAGNFFTRSPGELLRLKMIHLGRTALNTYDLTKGDWAATRRLEMKNIYNLGARGIDPESIRLSIYRIGGIEQSVLDSVSYLEILGLDLQNNQTQAAREDTSRADAAQRGPDGLVDPRYLDTDNGYLFFPDLRPFDPSCVDLNGGGLCPESGTDRVAGRDRPRRKALGYTTVADAGAPFGIRYERAPADSDETNPRIYDLNDVREDYRKYYITGTFKAFQTDINLNHTSILENSETVRVGNMVLTRGTDYTITYETGQIRLLSSAARDPNANLQITYAYQPLFAQGDKSLVGFSTTYGGATNWDFSTTLLYESEGVAELRPRLQQEPSRTILGDMSGSWRARPWVLTQLTNALPLVSTNAPSNLTFTGALGLSMPNPNTKGNAYLDDMEGVVQTTSTGMARENWQFSSRPRPDLASPADTFSVADTDRLGALWFSVQRQVQARDMAPKLTTIEGNDYVSVLGLILLPNRQARHPWLGLVQPLSESSLDLSQAQYLEIWVNDFNKLHGNDPLAALAGKGKEIRVDVGRVSEDAVWDPRTPPRPVDGILNQEDKNGDLLFALTEDTGLDGLTNAVEPDSLQAQDHSGWPVTSSSDHAGDDYTVIGDPSQYPPEFAERIRIYRKLTGTEGNNRLDTEDLDTGGNLDEANDYYEYVLPLDGVATNGDSLAVIDVRRDYLGQVDEDNGWRLLRIPLNHATRRVIGTPDLHTVRHLRVWFNGFSDTTAVELQIASIDIVGNRWEKQAFRNARRGTLSDTKGGREFKVAVVSNKEDPGYTAPFQVRVVNQIPEREQSLSLEFQGLGPGEEVTAVRPLIKDDDYTLYQSVNCYVQPRHDYASDLGGSEKLEFFVRYSSMAGSDTSNTYEIATTLGTPNVWQSLDVPLSEVSRLKLGLPEAAMSKADSCVLGCDSTRTVTVSGGYKVRIYGRPSFSQVRRIQVGLRNTGTDTIHAGRVWFDELRLGRVRRDLGVKAAAGLNVGFADFASVNVSLAEQSADFMTLGQQQSQGASRHELSVGTAVNLDKLAPSLNLSLPLRYETHRSSSQPKFKASNNDILLSEAATDVDRSEASGQSMSLSIRRSSSQNTPWFIRHTLDALSVSGSYNRTATRSPSQIDTSLGASGSASYALNIADPPGLPLPGRMKLTPLPNQFSLAYTSSYGEAVSWSRDVSDPLNLKKLIDKTTRATGLGMQTSFKPLPPVTYSISSQRDLVEGNFAINKKYRRPLKIAGLNLGREISRTERISVSQGFTLTQFLRPRVSWTGEYTEDHRPTIVQSTDLDSADKITPDLKNLESKNTTQIGWTFPLGRLLSKLQGSGGDRRGPATGGEPGAKGEQPPAGGAYGRSPDGRQEDRPPAAPDTSGAGRSPGAGASKPPPAGTPAPTVAVVPPSGGPADSTGAGASKPPPAGTPAPTVAVVPPSGGPVDSTGAGAPKPPPAGTPAPTVAEVPPSGGPVDSTGAASAKEPAKRPKPKPRRGGIGGREQVPEEKPPAGKEKKAETPPPAEGEMDLEALRRAAKGEEDKGREAAEKAARPPSAGGGSLFQAIFRDLITFNDIKTNFSISNRTAVTRVHGNAPPEFRLGLNSDLGDLERAHNSTLSTSQTRTATASGTVMLLKDITVDTDFQWNDSETENNRLVSRSQQTTWPSLKMNLGSLERKLRLKRLFSNFTASSNYQRQEKVTGTGTNSREQVTVTQTWQPFFQFDAGLRNGWRTTFSTDRVSSTNESNTSGASYGAVVTDRTSEGYRLGLAKTLGAGGRGGSASKKSIDLNLNLTYDRVTNITRSPGRADVPTKTDDFQGRFSTSYRFTTTVSGSMQLSVGQHRDLVAGTNDRTMGLQATAVIQF